MSPVTIRPATVADAELIAWVEVEAARSNRPLGFWDLVFPGADAPRLALVADVVRSEQRSFAHWDGFLVAERDGVAIGALSGYDPTQKRIEHMIGALGDATARAGWSDAHQQLIGSRITPVMTCLSDTPDDRFVIEWVALKPEARGKGAAAGLLEAILARGRAAGHRKAQISFLIGNTAAQRTYERAGFAVVSEKRHADFEATFGAPGTACMWRDL
jgi:ribosomal protein S18 acetylase RimI-like enzyme